jgi:nucleotide-binding universal stress UspA family protein
MELKITIMKKVIVLIDFSEQSEYALKVAASLAKKHNSEILAMHMLELTRNLTATPEVVNQEYIVFLLKAAEKRFTEFLDKPYLRNLKVQPIIKHYKVFSEVNEVAEKHGADLVVMGSHGTDGLKEIFVGSNAEKVVRYSAIPVLVVKNEIEDFKADRFVFASDFRLENLAAFQKARAFCDMLGADLDLVYINTPGDNFLSTADAYKRIGKFLAKANAGLQVDIYNDYSIERGILNYAENSGSDAIGITTHGRIGLSHFFMGSLGEDVVNHSKIPVV